MATTNTGGDAYLIARANLEITLELVERLAASGKLSADDLVHIRAQSHPPTAVGSREDTKHLSEHLRVAFERIEASRQKAG